MSETSHHPRFDLASERVGTIYAKALYGAADAAGSLDVVVEELASLVHDVLDKHPLLANAVVSPRITHDERLQILDKAFAGRMSPTLLTFLKVLSGHNRLYCLREIQRAFHLLVGEKRGRVDVKVTSAQPLSEQSFASVSARLRETLGKDVEVLTSVNPALIGGLIVRIGDTVIDGSVAHQLENIRHQTLSAAAQQAKDALERFTTSET
ncbi:ATP synthase F1 subunit delta [Blastopirellula marina]|uniref:ATP synthase subunit delta n=1 Tax=Blastopirellula marina DSM 3645 TaxID=314230 RepID=A4A1A4_9BACT|nr:ATP synthase F1 subunit delta [Blastopirellula marina]EAQ77456.1 probable ATP synthase delta chain [Blastopirellula marina DSM 3645]